MSPRYEWSTANTAALEICVSGALLGENAVDEGGNEALVIGDPWASAYVVEGAPQDLWAFTQRLLALLPGWVYVDVDDRGPASVVIGDTEVLSVDYTSRSELGLRLAERGFALPKASSWEYQDGDTERHRVVPD